MHRKLHHTQTISRAGMRRGTMRRRAAGNEMYFTQAALFERLYRQTQMSVMDWVEGAAEYADWAISRQLKCQSAHI